MSEPLVPLRPPEDDVSSQRDLLRWVREQIRPPWWHEAAQCKTADPDLFFVGQGKNSNRAKVICAQCPVAGACLDYALGENFATGIWGGMTPHERYKEKARRRRAASAPSRRLVGA